MYFNRVHSNGDTTHGGLRDKDKAGLGQCLYRVYRQTQRETARVFFFLKPRQHVATATVGLLRLPMIQEDVRIV